MATVQQVIFRIDQEEYGFDISDVFLIENYQDVIKVPNTPKYVDGIINLRGEIIPIYSLRKKFNLEDKEVDEDTKIIVSNSDGMKIGFIVDSVAEILHLKEQNIEEMPKLALQINHKYIKSVAKVEDRVIVLIDIFKVINDEEQEIMDKVIEDEKEKNHN